MHRHSHHSFIGRHGHGMRMARMLGSGELQLIILRLLAEKPRHGYEIIKAIEEHSSGIYAPSPGMVYPALTYLEETGYATAMAEGAKKLYHITPTGQAHLQESRSTADAVWNQLGVVGRRFAGFQQQAAEEEDIAENFGRGSGRGRRAEWHELKSEFHGLREELKAAIREKLNASLEEKQRVLAILRRTIEDIRKS
ncbi:MAG: PadR family transcriptional regulator [Steroidobacteraceae bacterium]